MRIVITSNYSIGNETGSSKVAELLSKYLSKRNKVLFICLGKRYTTYNLGLNLSVIEVPNMDLKTVQIPLIDPITSYKVFKLLDLFKPDIIHAQNSMFVSKLAHIWARINNTPFIITFHHIPTEALYHLVPELSKNILASLVQKIYKNTSLKNVLNNTDGVIAVNKISYDSISSIDKNVRVKVINNGIEIENLKKIKVRIPNVKNKNFVFLGSYNDRKNQLLLIKAFKYLPQSYQLNLYGNKNTGGEYLKQMEEFVKIKKITNVTIHDFSKSIDQVFDRNDFLISASKKEAQSLVVIQAMASGKPIIGVENETISELVDESNGLILKRKISPKMFAKNIKIFVENCDYLKLSKKIRKDSRKFDIKIVILKIEKFYKSICNSYSKNSRGNIGNYYNKILEEIGIIKK